MRFARVVLVCLPSLFFFGCPGPVPNDPCATVNCGAGRCIPNNGEAACLCDTTYVAQGLTCVQQTQADACQGNPCAATGKLCSSVNGTAICSCPAGYADQGAGCVKLNACNPSPCTAANQSCQTNNGAALCVCNAGYTPVGTGCSSEPTFDCAKNHSGLPGDDSFEPNECPETATPYDFSSAAQVHTLGMPGDEDWIRISPQAGSIVAIDFSASNVALYIDVYGQDGVTPIAMDHRGVSAPSFRFLAKTAETHFIRIRGLRANDVGTYTLTVSDAGQDDYTNVAANALTIAAGGSFDGEIQYTDDEDVIRMSVVSGHTYRLLLNTTTATGVQVEVIGADGTARKTLTEAVPTTGITHTIYARQDGTVMLRARSEGSGTLGTYSVTLSDYGLDDVGDLLIDATQLTPSPTAKTGNFETRPTGAPADIDVFTFAVEAGHIYAFTCTAGTYNYGCVMAMRDEGGTVLAQGSGSSVKTITWEAPATGLWNVSISPYSSYLGAVSYKLEDLGQDDYGDTRTAATALTVGTPKNGRIELSNDVDYFSFVAQAQHIYQIGCTPDSALYYCSTRLLDATGTQIGSTSSSTLSFEAPTGGTYYVEIKPYYSGYSGTYTLAVSDIGTDDHGDNIATATALTLGTAKAGAIELSGDTDFFSISAAANSIYSVGCTTSTSYLCYLTVRDPSGLTVVTTSYGTSVTTGFRALSTGTYTVEARSYSTSYTGSYSLTVTNTGTDDHGDTALSATAATLGSATTGNIQFASDKDFFSFTAATGRIYKVSCTTSTSYLCVLNVRNPSGTSVASASYSTASLAAFESTVAGTFTVEVAANSASYTGAYTLTITDEGVEDHGDSIATATPITAGGSAINGRIELAYDLDFFSFTAVANKLYRFTCASTDYYACMMTVRNASGTSLATTSYGTGTGTTVTFLAATAGSYYLETKASSTYTSAGYTVQLFDDGTEDHGNTAATATPITIGGAAIAGRIEMANDLDFFSFTGVANKLYRFTCTSTDYYACVMTVRNASGTALQSTSYGTGSGTTVTFLAPTAGSYYLEAKAYSTYTATSYSVRLFDDGFEDHGNTAATATTLTPGSAAATGKIEVGGDVDMFAFNATVNHIYRFTCTTSSSYFCVLTVRNAAGTTVTSASYGTSRVVSFTATATAQYTVEVKAYYATSTYVGQYTYQLFDDGVDDYGDTAAASTTTLTLPQTVTGTIQSNTDKDVVKFNAVAGTLYKFTCTGSTTYSCQLLVRDGANVSLGYSAYGASVTHYIKAASTGLFSVEVSNANLVVDSWSLTVAQTTDDHGDTQATGTAITVGTSVTGVAEYVGDYDYFVVNLNAGQTYSVSTLAPQIYPYIAVYNSAGTSLVTEDYLTRTFTATTAGTYYIRLRPYSASYLGNYTLLIQ